MILLSDANVLIDFGYVHAVALLPRIAPVEVLDVVLEECRQERWPRIGRRLPNAELDRLRSTLGCV